MSYEDIVQMWKGFCIQDSTQLGAYLENFSVLFAYHSGKIENENITYHDTREIFENGRVINYTGDLKTLYEIENMKSAYKLMMEWFDRDADITQERIKEMHYELTKGTYDERRWSLGERPGEYKKNDIWCIGEKELAAPIEDIEQEMEEDISQIMEITDQSNILVAAAWWHMRFEGIHAFADGNGRTGRAIMNYYLIKNDYPPVIIYQDDKQIYYDALEYFDETGEIQPMVDFLKDQTCRTWEKTHSRYHREERNYTEECRQRTMKMHKNMEFLENGDLEL